MEFYIEMLLLNVYHISLPSVPKHFYFVAYFTV